jgi:DUF4097 and DUF4098 domain-containing protein YvlB
MKTSRVIPVLVAAGLVLSAASAQAAGPGPGPGRHLASLFDVFQSQTEKFAKTVALPKGGAVEIANISGDITITAGSGDQVVIDATKKGRTADELKSVTIEVASSGNRVEIRTNYPEGRRNISVSVDYVITLPKSAAVTVKSISGDERITGVEGELSVTTISGDVTVNGAGDLRTVKSVSGDVRVSASRTANTLVVSSVSGEATITDVKANEVQINTVSGDVVCNPVVTTRLSVKSVSGDVTFGGGLAKSGHYELTSHSGNIEIFASDKVGFELSGSSFSGSITSDLSLTSKGGSDEGGRGRRGGRKTLQGTFGDGSASVQATAFSGDIRIVKK